jgi:hypothetical protein
MLFVAIILVAIIGYYINGYFICGNFFVILGYITTIDVYFSISYF